MAIARTIITNFQKRKVDSFTPKVEIGSTKGLKSGNLCRKNKGENIPKSIENTRKVLL